MRHFITFRGIDNGNDVRLDVSAICNSRDTSVTDARCTKTFTSASSQASFIIGWTPDKVTDPYDGSVIDREALYGQAVQYVLMSVESKAEMHVEILDDTRTQVIFTGMIDPTDISISRSFIPKTINLSCRDYTTDLDKRIGHNLVYNNKGVNEIVNELLDMVYGAEGGHNGIGDGLMHTGVYDALSDLPDTRTVEYFVITAEESTTYRKALDTLLMETGPGCVLHYVHSTNRFEVVKAITDETDDTQIRTVAYKTEEGIQARTGVYKYDGILLKWPTVEVRDSDNVYAQDIELKYSQDGGVTGALVANGVYFPTDGDITPTRQEYRKGDYDYVTGVSRSQNRDLGLLYAADAELGILAEPVVMRSRGTVADMDELAALADPRPGDYAKVTDIDEYRAYDGNDWVWTQAPSLSPDGTGDVYHDKGVVTTYALLPSSASEGDFYKCSDTGLTWCRMDGEWQRKISLFLFPVLETPDVDMTDGNPAFYPRSMWALGRNRSGGMVNLVTLSVTATSVARTRVNSTTHPSVIKEPEEYSATYIFDTGKAEAFALWMYNAHRIACTTVTWYEWEDQRVPLSVLGERVKVEFMPGRKAVFCVIQIDDTGITRLKRKYKITALLVSGFASAFSGTHEVTVPSAGESRTIVQTVYSFANSSSGSVTPTSWSSTRDPQQGKYLWTKTVTYYSDGTSEITYSSIYVPKDGEDADLTGYSYEVEYGLSDSPSVFHFPTATLGYQNNADTSNLGYEDDDYGFDDVASWSGSCSSWYKGLYVWQRMKVTDRDGNVTYTDPTYCRELTESLEQSCDLQVSTNPETYTYNARRTDYQYLPLLVRSIGMKGTLTLSCDLGVFSTYDPQTGLYTDVGQTVQVQINGGTVDVGQYYVKIAYTLRNDVTVTASLLQWTSVTVETELVIPYMQAKTATVQLTTVPAYADLPSSLNLTDSQEDDIVTGNNLVYGDYILTKYITLTPDDADTASDETGMLFSFNAFSDYYTRSGDTFSLAQISAFVVGTTYYAFRMYPWKYNGASWERTEDSGIKVDTLNEIINLAKAQKTDYPSADVDYHECLYAYEAFIQNLTVGILNVGDIFANNIQSNGYQEDNDGTPTQGYKLEYRGGENQSGQIKSVGGLYKNINIRGILNLYKSGTSEAGAEIQHPTLTTVKGAQGDSVGVTSNAPARWGSNELYNNSSITANTPYVASGTYQGYTLWRLLKATQAYSVYQEYDNAFYYNEPVTIAVGGTYRLRTLPAPNPTTVANGNDAYIYVRVTHPNGSTQDVYAGHPANGQPPQFDLSISLDSGESFSYVLQGGWAHSPGFTENNAVVLSGTPIASVGLWISYKEPSGSYWYEKWVNLGTDNTFDSQSTSLSLSSPVSFVSSNNIHYCNPTNIINYTSYTAGGTTHQIELNIPYKVDGSLYINGVSKTLNYFMRNSASSVTIGYGSAETITLDSSGWYYISCTIKIAGYEDGVETMAVYPKADYTYDIGRTGDIVRRFRNVYCQSVIQGSKRDLKTNIQPFGDDAVELLKSVSVCSYNFKSDMNIRAEERINYIGFIADDTDERLSGKGHDKFLGTNCIGVLIKAIQELSAEIDKLKGGH